MLDDARQAYIARVALDRVVYRALARSDAPGGPPLDEVLNETLYDERARLSRERPSTRAEADRAFYADLRRELPRASERRRRELLRAVVSRYVDEISGHFDPRVYAFATRALPLGLTALLEGVSPRRLWQRFPRLLNLEAHVLFEGEVSALRELSRRGTVILAPTHASNLDSLVMGWSIFAMGLPPFVYGAGLNLFTNPLTSFFMRNLGAYTVDRAKTDPLYREALKEYASAALEAGEHSLFFPGGTRSRSGALETHLKKGLLGAGIAAFQNNLRAGRLPSRVFIVPCTCTYPLVLEAATLVEDYLAHEGRWHYIAAEDEFSRARRWVDFLGGLVDVDLRIHLRVGAALDPVGNDVDSEGVSHGPHGRVVDPARYVTRGGAVVEDHARDAEYTTMLAARLLEAYRRDNVALATSVVAYAFLDLLRRNARQPDLYRFLRGLGPESSRPRAAVEAEVSRAVGELRALAAAGKIQLDPCVRRGDAREMLDEAARTFSAYHTAPVIELRGESVHVGDANLIFYYRNRLEGYGLLGAPALVPHRPEP